MARSLNTGLCFEVLEPFEHEFETPGGMVKASYAPGYVYTDATGIPGYRETIAGWIKKGKARDVTAKETKEEQPGFLPTETQELLRSNPTDRKEKEGIHDDRNKEA